MTSLTSAPVLRLILLTLLSICSSLHLVGRFFTLGSIVSSHHLCCETPSTLNLRLAKCRALCWPLLVLLSLSLLYWPLIL